MNKLMLLVVKFFLILQNFLLKLVEFWTCPLFRSISDPQRILLLRNAALGDFIFSVPAMLAIRSRYPNARIVFMTASSASEKQVNKVKGYTGNDSLPWLSFVIPSIIDDAICIRSFDIRNIFLNIRKSIINYSPDLTVILAHPGEPGFRLLKKIVFLRLVGVQGRIFGWRAISSNMRLRRVQFEAGFFEHHVISPLKSVHEIPTMPALDTRAIKFPIHINENDTEWINQLWIKKSLSSYKVIAMAPGSIQPHKRWPLNKYISLCQKLISEFNIIILIIGIKSDSYIGKELESINGELILNLMGITSVTQSAALLQRCVLTVGNDGGAMHLATAVGCPAVSIIPGIEYPNSIEPWFSKNLAVRHNVSCSPCYNFTHCSMEHNKCMQDIPIQDVYDNCRRVLEDVYK